MRVYPARAILGKISVEGRTLNSPPASRSQSPGLQKSAINHRADRALRASEEAGCAGHGDLSARAIAIGLDWTRGARTNFTFIWLLAALRSAGHVPVSPPGELPSTQGFVCDLRWSPDGRRIEKFDCKVGIFLSSLPAAVSVTFAPYPWPCIPGYRRSGGSLGGHTYRAPAGRSRRGKFGRRPLFRLHGWWRGCSAGL